MNVPTMDGIEALTVGTERLTTRVLACGDDAGIPVLFLHGNISSATWWEETMLALPDRYRALAPDQRGYGDADPEATIDAARGMADLADDAVALLDRLGIQRAHVVGNSMGGSVAWWLMADHAERISSVVLVDPGSPYGYGASRDEVGTPTTDDFAGSGAGLVNPEMVDSFGSGDRGVESPLTARNVFRTLIVKPPLVVGRENALIEAMLSTHFGDRGYPGDSVPSPNWPFVAPGAWGAANGLSPKNLGGVPERVLAAEPKPHLLWIRGVDDVIISDGGPLDPGSWGPTGLVPGFPGPEGYPPQPMVSQTAAFLDRYEAVGGTTRRDVIQNSGHVPFIEQPEEFNRVLVRHLDQAQQTQGESP